MPVQKAAFKALRQNRRRAERNLQWKMQLRHLQKRARQAVASTNPDLDSLIRQINSLLDKMAKLGILHANTAARSKSRLAKKLSVKK